MFWATSLKTCDLRKFKMNAVLQLKRSKADQPKIGLIHFGPGAFFRGFNAVFTSEVMQAEGGDWGICAVSLRSSDIRDKLVTQDYAYTSVTLDPQKAEHQVIEVIQNILVAPESPKAVLDAMISPDVKIVSMTITEKGYCHNPANGDLRDDDADILHDLEHEDNPRTAIGFLVHALNQRRIKGLLPFTVLSCDNLPNNGALTKNIVLAFANKVDRELADWIHREAKFPSTMVDRITPATTDKDVDALLDIAGYYDEGCVVHEHFRQWVIEDDFVDNCRPNWNLSGAQFVKDVEPFELMKLRCLNGTHSALAYLGYLAGYETVFEAVSDEDFAGFIDRLWTEEIIPTLPQLDGIDLAAYCADLKKRYQNSEIRHLTWQIAMDGSQKIPQRILGTIRDNLRSGASISGLALVVAACLRYVGAVDEQGSDIDVKDPLAVELKTTSQSHELPEDKVKALLALRAVFDEDLANDNRFCSVVTNAYISLTEMGSKNTVKAHL